MPHKKSKNNAAQFDGVSPHKKTVSARGKVEGLRDFLRTILTVDALDAELRDGLTLDWEGLRAKAACGSDALHKNNPTLRKEIEKEKSRLDQLAAQIRGGAAKRNLSRLTGAEERLKQGNDGLRLENKKLEQKNKSLEQELNSSRHDNLGLLSVIANLEQELRQLKHSSGLN